MTKLFARTMAAALGAGLLAAPAPLSAQDARDRVVTIRNAANEAIFYVYFSNTGASSWGDDQLGGEETISAGGSRTFDMNDGSGACQFDVKVEFANGTEQELRDVNVCGVSTITASFRGLTVTD